MKEVINLMKERLLMAYERFEKAVDAVEDVSRRYQLPPPPVNFVEEREREGLRDGIVITFQSANDDNFWKEWKERYTGVLVAVVVRLNTQLRCIQRVESGVFGFDLGVVSSGSFSDAASVVSRMCDPLFVDLVIKNIERAAETLERWCNQQEEAALKRIEENKGLIEKWQAEIAVERLAGGDRR